MHNDQISLARLKEVLSYDPESGSISWRTPGTGRRAEVGYKKPDGRKRVAIDGKRFVLARLCWFYVHGQWPSGHVDHINGNPSDDRISNLRDVPAAVNNQNRRRHHRDSKTRLMGVVKTTSGTFNVSMSFRGRTLSVYGFRSEKDAHEAYAELKRRIHDGFVEVQS